MRVQLRTISGYINSVDKRLADLEYLDTIRFALDQSFTLPSLSQICPQGQRPFFLLVKAERLYSTDFPSSRCNAAYLNKFKMWGQDPTNYDTNRQKLAEF